MKMIYNNFDGLDVAFQGAFPEEALVELANARERAKLKNDENEGEVISLGANKRIVKVAATGAKGGYAFRFDTGPDGATWFVKNSLNPQRWNLRVSLKSLNIALNGYERARDNLIYELIDYEAISCLFNLEGDRLPPKESVGRIDYCFDFLSDDFSPLPESFVVHSRTTVKGVIPVEIEPVWRGNRIESITVGKMPNRQVIIYDKTAEIISKQKHYWWDIWGLKKDAIQGRIWRVEVRAGKGELKEWNIDSFFALEYCMGNVLTRTLHDIRYSVPSEDSNRSRWPLHPIWQECQAKANEALAAYISDAPRKKIIKDLRENLVNRAQKNLRGSIATYSHLLGHGADEIAQTLAAINEDVTDFASTNDFLHKRKKAEDKYVFLKEEGEG